MKPFGRLPRRRGRSADWAEIMRRNHARAGAPFSRLTTRRLIAATVHRRGKVPFRTVETDLHDGRWLWMTEPWTRKAGCCASPSTLRRCGRGAQASPGPGFRAQGLTGGRTHQRAQPALHDGKGSTSSSATAREPAHVGVRGNHNIDYFKAINDRYGHHRVMRCCSTSPGRCRNSSGAPIASGGSAAKSSC